MWKPRFERFGRLDILVNNAATNPYFGPSIDIDLPRFDKIVNVNFRAPFEWSQRRRGTRRCREEGGVIINISSIGGFEFGVVDSYLSI